MKKLNDNFGFIDIAEVELNPDRNKSSNIGKDVYVMCPDLENCSGHGYFTLSTKFGQCYICGVTFKLHKKYHTWSEDRLVSTLFSDKEARQARRYTEQTSQPAPIIQSAPNTPKLITTGLSDKAKDYISSRGITEFTLNQFSWLQETHLWGSEWLCYPNESGGYELREIGGLNRHAMPAGSHKNITSKQVGRRGGYAGLPPLVITEGLFSAMSYYEFKDYPDSHCLILNSVQMVSRATEYDWSRFAEVVLALDTDAAGMKGKVQLAKFFLEKYPHIKIKVDHPPIVEMDWNDYLRDQKKKG